MLTIRANKYTNPNANPNANHNASPNANPNASPLKKVGKFLVYVLYYKISNFLRKR